MPWLCPPRTISWLTRLSRSRPDRQILLLVAALSLSPFILESLGLLSLVDAAARILPGSPVNEAASTAMAGSRDSLPAIHLAQHLLILALAIGAFVFGWLCRRLSHDDDIAAWGFVILGLGLLHTVPVLALESFPGIRHGGHSHAAALSAISRGAAMIFVATGLWILTRRGRPRQARHWRFAVAGLAGLLGAATLLTVAALRAGLVDESELLLRLAGVLPLLLWGLAVAVAATAPARRERGNSCLERATMLALVPLGTAQAYLAFASRSAGDNHPSIAHGLLAGACLLGCGSAAVDLLRMHDAQRGSRERRFLRGLIDALPQLVTLKDAEGRFTLVNRAAAEFIGREADQIIGRDPADWGDDPGVAARYREEDRLLLSEMRRVTREDTLPDASGRLRVFHSLRQPILSPDEDTMLVLGVATEITQMRVAEAALRTSEERWRTMIENQGEGVGIVDPQERFTFANPAAERIFGVPRGGLEGRGLAEFLTEPSLARIRDEATRNRQGERASNEVQITTPEGVARDLLVTVTPHLGADGAFAGLFGIFRDITANKRAELALRMSLKQTRLILDQASDPFITLDEKHTVTRWNRRAEELFGWPYQEVTGRPLAEFIGDVFRQPDGGDLLDRLAPGLADPTARAAFRSTARTRDGRELPVEVSAWSVRAGDQVLVNAFMRDLSEAQTAQREKEILDVQLLQAQKLEAIGQLAAGIAHEINTPTQYVGDNLRFLADAFTDVTRALEAYGRLLAAVRAGQPDTAVATEVAETLAGLDLDYLASEVPAALRQSLEGVDRVATIVRAMKEFSHPGTLQKQAVDINHGILNTITVSRNEWKYVAELETDLDKSLPAVPCLPGELNQVILNLIVNGAHAIRDRIGDGGAKGSLRVTTRRAGDWVEIRVADDGAGIPAAIRERVFEPFFTTKEVGKGTGQGLTIAHAVVTKKHGGTLTFETEEGRGTTFIIRLPLDPERGQARGEAVHEEEHTVR